MSFRADRIYLEFLRLTRRLSNQQIMMLLAVVVGVCSQGWEPTCSKCCCTASRAG